MIREAWIEHKAIRDVMIFLQGHGISTLFSVRIYKKYGDDAIRLVTEDPYRLANDFFGIGFFSADKVALSIGLTSDSRQRITAGIRHVLAASRDLGHCYLTLTQINEQVKELLQLDLSDKLSEILNQIKEENLLMVRELEMESGKTEACYYSKSLYFDELYVAKRLSEPVTPPNVDKERVEKCKGVKSALDSL
ncbi:MAG: helix-hairpin-helix domain-containing protein [Sulfurimonas sp.]